ncbi:hypothetical protein [Glutamicibacter creatinolyticus]|uniref:hypothetical protein n=1 Tax=Glutamicibacter creatinolyticus TaxID=162496 RepID=UPI0037C179AF
MSTTLLKAPVIQSSPTASSSGRIGAPHIETDIPPVRVGERNFWLDGSAIIAGQCVRRTSDLQYVVPAAAGRWTLRQIGHWWSNSASNASALYVQDAEQGWAACFPDPLGGAVAYSYATNEDVFVSTSIQSIVERTTELDIPISKDPLFQIERLIFGNGGLTPSSYRKVTSLEPFQYYSITGQRVSVENYTALDDLSSASSHELFGQLINDVLNATSAISKTGSSTPIAHLTGGFDSRLVLGSILKLGVKDQFLMFCSGPEGSTDRKIADGLTHTLKLRRTNSSGLANAPTTNMSERLLGALFASGGITSTGPYGRELDSDIVALGGGYGEVLRTFYGSRLPESVSDSFDTRALCERLLPKESQHASYISGSAISQIKSKLTSRLNAVNTLYNDISFLPDAFYTHVRNRYHIGQSSLLWSRVGSRFDPLYSVAGFELSRRSGSLARKANVLGFDLMESLQKELLSYQFDYDRFSPELSTLRKRPAELQFVQTGNSITFEPVNEMPYSMESPFLSTLRKLQVSEPTYTAKERSQLVEKANSLGVNFWQVAYQRTGQELLLNALQHSGDNEVLEIIDSKYINDLSKKIDLKRRELRDLYNLGGILTWLSFA